MALAALQSRFQEQGVDAQIGPETPANSIDLTGAFWAKPVAGGSDVRLDRPVIGTDASVPTSTFLGNVSATPTSATFAIVAYVSADSTRGGSPYWEPNASTVVGIVRKVMASALWTSAWVAKNYQNLSAIDQQLAEDVGLISKGEVLAQSAQAASASAITGPLDATLGTIAKWAAIGLLLYIGVAVVPIAVGRVLKVRK